MFSLWLLVIFLFILDLVYMNMSVCWIRVPFEDLSMFYEHIAIQIL